MSRILVIDNYDSFVYTLVGYLKQLDAQVDVVRNDDVDVADFDSVLDNYDGILISPGPGAPQESGISLDAVSWAADHNKPLFGVCLGLQIIAEAYGATVTHAPELMHGKTSVITHSSTGIFEGVKPALTVGRYHSLAVKDGTLPEDLNVTAKTDNGIIMAIEHTKYPQSAVQFHPESILTEEGSHMLKNWLESIEVQVLSQ